MVVKNEIMHLRLDIENLLQSLISKQVHKVGYNLTVNLGLFIIYGLVMWSMVWHVTMRRSFESKSICVT